MSGKRDEGRDGKVARSADLGFPKSNFRAGLSWEDRPKRIDRGLGDMYGTPSLSRTRRLEGLRRAELSGLFLLVDCVINDSISNSARGFLSIVDRF